MKKIAVVVCSLALAVVLQAPAAHAETTASSTTSANVSSLLATLKSLMAQVASLQSQIKQVRSDVKTTITTGVQQGMTNDQIKQIQQLLATDKSIYPEGITSGYFGDLTKKALERFQEKHGLPSTGQVDSNTQDLLNQYLNQRYGTTTVPKGLLTAPGILKKVQDNICGHEGQKGGVWGVFCKGYTGTTTPVMQHHGTSTDDHDSGHPNGWIVCTGGTATGCHPSFNDPHNVATSTYQTARIDRAQQAIDAAQSQIDTVQASITAATSSNAAAAQTKLNQAKAQLNAAQTAFDAKLYGSAAIDADMAKATAVAAGKLL